MTRKRRRKRTAPGPRLDPHVLYEAAVQCVDADIDFFQRVYRRHRGKPARLLEEDFCGTAALACAWVKRNRANRAWGVDRHLPTLDWGRRHNVAPLGRAADRLVLLHGDVLTVRRPRVDVVAALNFSYMVFKTRDRVLRYFRRVRGSLRRGGILFLDAFGGTESVCALTEERRIPRSRGPDGQVVPAFGYVWEQADYNAITHDIRCYIHFMLPDGTRMNRAFRYDWRLWTLAELRELLVEAGFAGAEVYLENWDDDANDSDGIFRRRLVYDNEGAWIGYVVGLA